PVSYRPASCSYRETSAADRDLNAQSGPLRAVAPPRASSTARSTPGARGGQPRRGKRRVVAEPVREPLDIGGLVRQNQRDARTAASRPAGAADSMHVVVMAVRRVEVDEVCDVVDVETAF